MCLVFLFSPVCKGNNPEIKIRVKKVETPSIMKIVLAENITTGYKWNYGIQDKSTASIIYDKYVEKEHKKGLLGVGGKHIWYVLVKKAGKTKIIFKLESWDGKLKDKITYKIKAI